jgi:hypothetical protein
MIQEYTPSPDEAAALALLETTKRAGWITGSRLAICLWDRDSDRNRREVRAIIKNLREAGYMIFSEQGRGYTMCLDYGQEAAKSLINRGMDIMALGKQLLGEIAEARRKAVALELFPTAKNAIDNRSALGI